MTDIACGYCGKSVKLEGKVARCKACGSTTESIVISGNRMSAYSPGVADVEEPSPPEDGTEERCPVCRKTLLGIWFGGVLQIKHHGREWWVSGGTIGVKCHPRCGGILNIDTTRYQVNIVSSLDSMLLPVDATDSAVKLAKSLGIQLGTVSGSGKDGRILKKDVEAYRGDE